MFSSRVAKLVSAVTASIFRWLVSVTKTFSGFCAMLRRNKTAPPSMEKQPATPVPQKSSSYSEWEKCVSDIVSLAKQEIAEILPGWSIDIHTLKSPDIQCHEFVLRAETHEQEWAARLLISYHEIHMGKSSLALVVSKRLSKLANDIRCEAIALGYIDDKPAPRFNYRVCDTCNVLLMPRESGYFTCARCAGSPLRGW